MKVCVPQLCAAESAMKRIKKRGAGNSNATVKDRCTRIFQQTSAALEEFVAIVWSQVILESSNALDWTSDLRFSTSLV